jgi:hypothetical protein
MDNDTVSNEENNQYLNEENVNYLGNKREADSDLRKADGGKFVYKFMLNQFV